MGDEIDQKLLATRVAEDEAAFKSITEGLVITDHEGRVVLLNPPAGRMLGWPGTSAVGLSIDQVAPIRWRKGEERSILSMSFAALRKKSDFYLIRKDGSEFLAAISASSIILAGRVVGTVMIFRDETLEQQALRAESDFIAIASHQLRTPLGSMKWNLEMLASGEFGELPLKARRVVQTILSTNREMVVLVNDLLSVSRISQHRIPDRPEMIDLVAEVARAVDEISTQAASKGVTVSFDFGSLKPMIYLDRRRFFEAVSNLLSNGVKYNHPGGKVAVSLSPTPSGVLLKVADTGIGISKEDQKRLFQVFFRSDEAIKREAEGTGLGLYVVASYARMWGGKAWCESTVGKGATFYVEIPWKQKQ